MVSGPPSFKPEHLNVKYNIGQIQTMNFWTQHILLHYLGTTFKPFGTTTQINPTYLLD